MIGKRLQELRKEFNISQAQLAKILGVSHYTISSYECNRSDPDDISKVKLAKLFNVSVDYLLGLVDKPVSFLRDSSTIIIPNNFIKQDICDINEYIAFLEYKKKIQADIK